MLIDINVHRQRIGMFSQPGQRKFKMHNNCTTNKKQNRGFSISILQLILLLSTLSYLQFISNDQQTQFLSNEGWKNENWKIENFDEPALSNKQPISKSSNNNWYAQ